jgi:hypothetical protein
VAAWAGAFSLSCRAQPRWRPLLVQASVRGDDALRPGRPAGRCLTSHMQPRAEEAGQIAIRTQRIVWNHGRAENAPGACDRDGERAKEGITCALTMFRPPPPYEAAGAYRIYSS